MRIRREVARLLFFAGVTVYSLSIAGKAVSWVPLDSEIGLLDRMPYSYWVGLFLLLSGLLLSIAKESSRVFLVEMAVATLLLKGLPVLIVSNVYHWDAVFTARMAAFYADRSLSDPYVNGSLFSGRFEIYAGWPGFLVLGTLLSKITGAGYLAIAKYAPLFFAQTMLLAVAAFFRLVLRDQTWKYALFVGTIGNAWTSYHFVPQSAALPVAILALLALAKERRAVWAVVLLVLLGAVIVSHGPTSLLLVFAVSIAFVTGRASRRQSEWLRGTSKIAPYTVLFVWVAFSGWMLYEAEAETNVGLRALVDHLTSLSTFLTHALERRYSATAEATYSVAPVIRLLSFILVLLGSLVGAALSLRWRRHRGALLVARAYLVGAFAFFVFDLAYSGGGWLGRTMFWVVAVAPLFIGVVLETVRRRRVLAQALGISFLCAGLASWTFASYDANYYIVSDSALRTSAFISQEIGDTLIIGGESLYHLPAFYHSRTRAMAVYDIHLFPSNIWGPGPRFTVLDRYSELWYRGQSHLYTQDYQFFINESRGKNGVYTNGDYAVYR